MNVYRAIVHSSYTVEITQMFTNWCMDKQNIVCSYNEVLTSHKKNEVESCSTTDESWKHYTKWNKTVTKGYNHIFYNCLYETSLLKVYMKCPGKSIEMESKLVGIGRKRRQDCQRVWGFSLGWWKFCKIRWWWQWLHGSMNKTHQIVQF